MAKVFGSYADLHGGNVAHAFRALTGLEEQIYWKRDRSTQLWGKATLQKGSDKFIVPGRGRETKNCDDFFEHARGCDQQNFLMAASITGGRESHRSDGLVEGHAYSVMQVMSIQLKSHDLKLVMLRNPWGNEKEWRGAWSDRSPLWKQFPEVKQKLSPTVADDGIFWMSWGDFSGIFDSFFVCEKAMREGEEAKEHALASVDWRHFRPPRPAPKPGSHGRQVDPLVPGLASVIFRLGLKGPEGRAGDVLDEGRWQVELKAGQWVDFEEEQQSLLEAAYKRNAASAKYEARGFDYEVLFDQSVQKNLKSGRERCVRRTVKFTPPQRETRWVPKVGEPVKVWSESQKSWQRDGKVLQVDSVGAVRVQYNDGASLKWIPADQVQTLLRRA
eukprot:TRINITY_DN33218_c0_g1_i1.p1 TRINITY_DN33218_c0_g1~~TRINITY_DN33218_c0_g1_i1.p1  ORF type:complete len:430 (+),score=89.30 TRINITY_DN33218_c0_g1_i1:132-1292(+)